MLKMMRVTEVTLTVKFWLSLAYLRKNKQDSRKKNMYKQYLFEVFYKQKYTIQPIVI